MKQASIVDSPGGHGWRAWAGAHGLGLKAAEGRLTVHGQRTADPVVVATLLAAKTAVLSELLQPTADEWDAWVERAAIAEYDGHQSRPEAETLAWEELMAARAGEKKS